MLRGPVWRVARIGMIFFLVGICACALFPRSAHALSRQPQTVTGYNSDGTPSLAQLGNTLYLGWTSGDLASINIAQSSDGVNFTNQKTLTDSTVIGQGPSLATFNNLLYVAFMGGEHVSGPGCASLTCGDIHLGYYNGTNVLQNGEIITINGVAQTTVARPTIAEFDGKLYIAWAGTDSQHHLNVAYSTDGIHFTTQKEISDYTTHSPYLTVFNNQLHVTFTGTNDGIFTGIFNGSSTLQSHTYVKQTSQVEPATASFGGQLYLGWQGTDSNHSNNLAFASDGLHFSQPTHPSDNGSSTEFGPGLGTFNGHLYYVWTRSSSSSSPSFLDVTQVA